jgi:hypothetical protein
MPPWYAHKVYLVVIGASSCTLVAAFLRARLVLSIPFR